MLKAKQASLLSLLEHNSLGDEDIHVFFSFFFFILSLGKL
jgi:hypothetical protein